MGNDLNDLMLYLFNDDDDVCNRSLNRKSPNVIGDDDDFNKLLNEDDEDFADLEF